MGDLRVLARRLITLWGLAMVIAAPICVVAVATPNGPPAYLAQCNGGEEPDTFTTTCVPFMTPRTPGASATATGATACPPGVSGTECGAQGGGTDANNRQPNSAERAAANTEEIGEDVAGTDAGDA